jgi:hypothetical protein
MKIIYDSSNKFSLSSAGKPANNGGVSIGKRSLLNRELDHRGTHTSVNVGVLDNDIKP